MTDQLRTSDRFLEAFNSIDRLLRRRFDIDRGKGFYAVVELAAGRDRAVRRYELDLKEYADLRNAITHERTDGRAIAEPHPDTAAALESILERLTRPPKVGDLFRHAVERADVGEPVGRAAKAMLDGNFSQVPAYDGSRFAELLTAETIALAGARARVGDRSGRGGAHPRGPALHGGSGALRLPRQARHCDE